MIENLLSLTIGEGVPLVTLNYNKSPKTIEKFFFFFEFSYDTTSIVKATKNFRLEKYVWWRDELNKNALFISHSFLSFASSDLRNQGKLLASERL